MKPSVGVFGGYLAASVFAAPAIFAQDTQPQPTRLSFEQPVAARQYSGVATINPFAVIFGGFNGDIEMNIGRGFTGALSATWFPSEFDYTSVDLTFRYYPGELNPEGFSVGAIIGYLSVEDEEDDVVVDGVVEKISGPAVGFIGGYTWLLGKSDRLAIATGFGLKRLLADNGPAVTPTGRMGIGLAF